MPNLKHLPVFIFLLIVILFDDSTVLGQDHKGYILEIEKDIGQIDSIHFGGGVAIGYSFFQDVEDLKYIFRKRVLTPGSAIQYHLQKENEIYYILSGKGVMTMNDETFEVSPGFAVLTQAGSSHGLAQIGDEDLILIIVYEKVPPK